MTHRLARVAYRRLSYSGRKFAIGPTQICRRRPDHDK